MENLILITKKRGNLYPAIKWEDFHHFKPFISICIIITTLFLLVFFKMEQRRLGYHILKLTRAQNILVEEKRNKLIIHAKLLKPQNIEREAEEKLSMKKLEPYQIIHLTGSSYSF